MYFKIINKFRGHEWLKNGKDKTGAQNMVILSKPDDNIAVSSNNKYHNRIYTDVTPSELLKLCKFDIGLCEIIIHYKYKIYFDIDAKINNVDTIDTSNYLNNIISEINLIFPTSDLRFWK